MLGVFDTKAAVVQSVFPCHLAEDLEQFVVCPIADGMDRYRQARSIGRANIGTKLMQGRDIDARAPRIVDKRREHLGGAGAQGAIDETLEPANPKPIVAEAAH